MWQILKAELKYHRILIIFPSLAVLGALIGNFVQDWNKPISNLNGVKGVITAMFLMFYFFKIIGDAKEKRNRFYAGLPLRSWQLGLARLLPFFFIWLTYLSLFWITSATITPYPKSNTIWHTLSLNGFMLAAITFLYIMGDLLNSLEKSRLRLVLSWIAFLVMFCGYFTTYLFSFSIPYFDILQKVHPVKEEFTHLTSNLQSAIIFNLMGLVFIVSNIFSFVKRQTYI